MPHVTKTVGALGGCSEGEIFAIQVVYYLCRLKLNFDATHDDITSEN